MSNDKTLKFPCTDGKRHWWKDGWFCAKCGITRVELIEKMGQNKPKRFSSKTERR
ncbi:MAG: hypothetical protein KKD77_20760 [Gammaproteobacteria bacterium]|nr:hypothetical protein [Gammaproteobacteria bacterium]